MSDSYFEKTKSYNHWNKLCYFFDFRTLLEGVWINSSKFWFEAIMNDSIYIEEFLWTDSGGGPLHTFKIKVAKKYDKESLFDMTLSFGNTWSSHEVFSKRMKSMYRYMGTYADGDTFLEKALCKKFSKGFGFNPEEWVEKFSLTNEIEKVPFADLDDISNTYPYKGWELLANIDHLLKKDEIILKGESAKQVESARCWALMALLDMERYCYTSC